MPPLISIIALDFLICLVTRAVLDETDMTKFEEAREGEDPTNEPDNEKQEKDVKVAADNEQAMNEAFFNTYGRHIVPVLMKCIMKLLGFGHTYALSSQSEDQPMFPPQVKGIPQQALETLISLSAKNLVYPKDTKALFTAHIPNNVHERLKLWNSALPIDVSHKQKLCAHSIEDIQIDSCMVTFLDLHFTAFAGARTFDPARSIKSAISSIMSLLQIILELKPSARSEVVGSIVPLGCDALMEFAHSELMKMIENGQDFSTACITHKVTECFRLVLLPEMKDCDLLGAILADLFGMFISMLETPAHHVVLESVGRGEQAAGERFC